MRSKRCQSAVQSTNAVGSNRRIEYGDVSHDMQGSTPIDLCIEFNATGDCITSIRSMRSDILHPDRGCSPVSNSPEVSSTKDASSAWENGFRYGNVNDRVRCDHPVPVVVEPPCAGVLPQNTNCLHRFCYCFAVPETLRASGKTWLCPARFPSFFSSLESGG